MKGVYKMHIDCGRQGELEGVFIADSSDMKSIMGRDIHFGEVLGKHSEVSIIMTEGYFKLASTNPEVIKVIEENDLETGFNPFEYIYDEDDEDEDDED